MSARDELALILVNTQRAKYGLPPLDALEHRSGSYLAEADAILGGGFRKHRIVTNEAELEALPENTVIRDSEPATLQLMDGQWFVPGHDQPWYVESIDLPVTVIHEPS